MSLHMLNPPPNARLSVVYAHFPSLYRSLSPMGLGEGGVGSGVAGLDLCAKGRILLWEG